MWSSSKSPTLRIASTGAGQRPDDSRRRVLTLLTALVALPLTAPSAALASRGGLDDGAQPPLAGLRRWGRGEYRRFGRPIYQATLWAGDDPHRPPLALQLVYRRAIGGTTIAAASIDEIRRLGLADAATLQRWGVLLAALFPDVVAGDTITGLYLPDTAHFVFNGRALGAIDEAQFAHAFFAIWLDARTRAPELRAALLGAVDG